MMTPTRAFSPGCHIGGFQPEGILIVLPDRCASVFRQFRIRVYSCPSVVEIIASLR